MTPEQACFLTEFENCRLPADQWTHQAHVQLAWLQLGRAAHPIAIDRIRAGILRFNTEVLDRQVKYHDTVTVAFARLIAAAMVPDETFDAFCNRNPELLSKGPILSAYYSKERLSSDKARTSFIEPDLKPLP